LLRDKSGSFLWHDGQHYPPHPNVSGQDVNQVPKHRTQVVPLRLEIEKYAPDNKAFRPSFRSKKSQRLSVSALRDCYNEL
jgi:hypothetical protein